MTSASRPRGKGVTLDPSDANDRKIMARQVKVARQAGRDGLDRAGATRGRPDLEQAYDEGASQASAPAGDDEAPPAEKGSGGQPAAGKSTARRGGGFRQMGPGWKSVKPTMPTRLPTRASDAGGFLAGLAVYTVVVIYIRYGPAGWKGWLSAKFLNKPMSTSGATGAMGSKPTSPTTGGSRFV